MEINMPSTPKPSLYERLGGVYSIATVVDDFINRIMADPRLNANPLERTKRTTGCRLRGSSIW
jgi:truncated hemoglobin YjbI